LSDRHWQFYTAATSVIAVLVSVYCLSEDIQGIFVHLYYIPILIASYQYRGGVSAVALPRNGLPAARVLHFPGDSQILVESLIRASR
jgi:hypothetical protein